MYTIFKMFKAKMTGQLLDVRLGDLKLVIYAPVAQLVEQETENLRVPGSIPGWGTTNFKRSN